MHLSSYIGCHRSSARLWHGLGGVGMFSKLGLEGTTWRLWKFCQKPRQILGHPLSKQQQWLLLPFCTLLQVPGCLCILISKLSQVLVSLDLVPSCGMKWAGHDICSAWIYVHGNMVVISADLSLFILGASQQWCTPHEWNVGFSRFSICRNSSPSRQWACLLCVGPQHWDAKTVAWPHCPGCISACIIFIFLLAPCQKHNSQLMLFCHSTTLCVSLSKPSLYRSPFARF